MDQGILRNVILKTLDYIETNLRYGITLEELSDVSHFSKFHLHRLITAATGQPIMGYIRSRRLSESALDLLDSTANVIDVALRYGYNHEQSYIRAFKKHFGTTPARFRTGHEELALIGRFDASTITDVGDGAIFDPKFVVKPSCELMGRKHQIFVQENQATHLANIVGNDFYFNHRFHIPNRINDNIHHGLTTYCSDESFTYYTPSVEVAPSTQVPEGMVLHRLVAQLYAVFRYVGSFHAKHLTIHHLDEIWNYIRRWVDTSMYHHCKPFHFESIDTDLSTETYCEVDLYIPVSL